MSDTEPEVTAVVDGLATLENLEQEAQEVREHISRAILAARDSGISWERLAEATGQTVRRLEWARIQGDPEAMERERERQSKAGSRRPTLPTESGVSVAQAAKSMGMSRALLYRKIDGREAGEVDGWTFRLGERGKIRLYSPDEDEGVVS